MEEKNRPGLCELTLGPVLLLLCIVTVFLARDITVNAMSDANDPGPRSMPTLMALGMGFAGLFLSFTSWTQWRRTQNNSGAVQEKGAGLALVRGCLLTSLLVLYVYAWSFTGFTLATLVVSFILMKHWKVSTIHSCVVSIVLVLLIHLLFINLFKVPLPRGEWMP